MDALITGLITGLSNSGPIGAVIAAVIIGLALSLMAFAKTRELWSDTRGRSQGVELQDNMLAMIKDLRASEEALRKRIDDLGRENGAMRDEVDELRASLSLLRNQRRKLIEHMRNLRDGSAPAARGATEPAA